MALAWPAIFGISFGGLLSSLKGLEENAQLRKRRPCSETFERLRRSWSVLIAVQFVLCCWCVWNLAASL